jgi:hypothetical protein
MTPEGERSLAEVVEMVGNLEQLLRAAGSLVKAEVRDDVRQVVQGLKWRVLGAVLGVLAVGLALQSGVHLLSTAVAPWIAALAVGAAVGLIAVLLATAGRARTGAAQLPPEKHFHSRLDQAPRGRHRGGRG